MTLTPGAYPSEAPFNYSTVGYSPALPTNIRLGCIGLPRTNTLAYYENPLITTVKSFIVQAPEGFISAESFTVHRWNELWAGLDQLVVAVNLLPAIIAPVGGAHTKFGSALKTLFPYSIWGQCYKTIIY